MSANANVSARERILGRLRAAAPQSKPAAPDVHALYAAMRKDDSRAERIARFCAQMAFWRGEVVPVTADDWTDKLRELCAAKGVA